MALFFPGRSIHLGPPRSRAITIGVSVLKILLHMTRLNTLLLVNIPGTHIYQSMNRHREALRVPSFLVLEIELPIYFANSTYLQERILRWIREEEEWIKANNSSALQCLIQDITAVTAADTSRIETIRQVKKIAGKQIDHGKIPAETISKKLPTEKLL